VPFEGLATRLPNGLFATPHRGTFAPHFPHANRRRRSSGAGGPCVMGVGQISASSQKLTGVKSGPRILSMAKRSERELTSSEPTTLRCPRCDAERPVRRQRMGTNYRMLDYCGHIVTLMRGS